MQSAEGRGQRAEEIAGLLRYPDGDLRLRLQFAQDVLEGAALQAVIAFSEETARVSLDGMQELYTQTFDLNPVATLEIGWHLYGEQYERGRFLADLREQQDAVGVDATPELPDHLTAILAMIPRLDARLATSLVEEKLLPALEKIGKPLEENGNPYRHLISAARAVVGVPHGTTSSSCHPDDERSEAEGPGRGSGTVPLTTEPSLAAVCAPPALPGPSPSLKLGVGMTPGMAGEEFNGGRS